MRVPKAPGWWVVFLFGGSVQLFKQNWLIASVILAVAAVLYVVERRRIDDQERKKMGRSPRG